MKTQFWRSLLLLGFVSLAFTACKPARTPVAPPTDPAATTPAESTSEFATIAWDDGLSNLTSELELTPEVGDRFSFNCPADGSLDSSVWGTDIYTNDSAICMAAVHAGLFTTETGGDVTLEVMDGQDAYEGSDRNGVTSSDYPEWGSSYQFVEE